MVEAILHYLEGEPEKVIVPDQKIYPQFVQLDTHFFGYTDFHGGIRHYREYEVPHAERP